jgi:hypothetical protein
MLVALDEFSVQQSLIETRGEHVVLLRVVTTFTDGAAGPAEYAGFSIYEMNDQGLMTRVTLGLPDDLDAVRTLLNERAAVHGDTGNAAWRVAERYHDALNRRDWDSIVGLFDSTFVYDDRRNRMQYSEETALAPYQIVMELDEFHVDGTLLAARGERLALTLVVTSFRDGSAGPAEYRGYALYETVEERMVRISFGMDDLDAAHALLDARFAELERPAGNSAWGAAQRYTEAMNRRDWDALVAELHPDFEVFDHHAVLDGDDALAPFRMLFSLDECRIRQSLEATRGDRLALVHVHTTLRDGATGVAEHEAYGLHEVDDAGLLTRVTMNLTAERGYELLDERSAEIEASPAGNAAWRAALGHRVLIRERDWDAFVSTLHPDFEVVDHHSRLRGGAALESFRVAFSVKELSTELTLLATRGEHLALIKTETTLRDGQTGSAEISMFVLNEVDDQGRFTRVTFNLPEGQAYEALETRYAELEAAPASNRAWELHLKMVDAAKRNDRDGFKAYLHPDFAFHDYRSGVAGRYDEDNGASMLAVFDIDIVSWDVQLIATAGDGLALNRTVLRASSRQVGEAEWVTYRIDEIHPDGRLIRVCGFNADALDQAMAVFNARYVELQAAPASNRAWELHLLLVDAARRKDLEGFKPHLHPDFEFHDYRSGVAGRYEDDEGVSMLAVFDMEVERWDSQLLATAGDRLALFRSVLRARTRDVGEAAWDAYTLDELAPDGRLARVAGFNIDALDEAMAVFNARAAELSSES